MFFEIGALNNFHRKTTALEPFLIINFIKNFTSTHVLSCEICKNYVGVSQYSAIFAAA